jgi:hypothetical protein
LLELLVHVLLLLLVVLVLCDMHHVLLLVKGVQALSMLPAAACTPAATVHLCHCRTAL